MKKVIIGSKNPVKIEAVKLGFEEMFPGEIFEFIGISVPSGVSDQPMSAKETYQGALNRAHNCLKENPTADFGVGLEGGLWFAEWDETLLLSGGYTVVIDNQGLLGFSGGGGYPLPPKVQELVLSGLELGSAADQVFNETNSKQDLGTIGLLTGGALNRTASFKYEIIKALIPHKNKDLYQR